MKSHRISFWLYNLFSFVCLCQGVAQTPIQFTNYNYKDYKGGIQNWGITVSPEQVLYAGNNNGLLTYNGNDWSLLEPDERTTVRAVRHIGNRIYTAGNNNIGYWEQEQSGKMTYTSLLPLVNQLGIFGDTFWSIASQGKDVYFQSFGNIIRFDGERMDYVVKQDCYSLLFETGGQLFTQRFGGSFYQIHGNKPESFCDDPLLQRGEAKFMFQSAPDSYLIGLSNGEIYTLQNGQVSLLTRLVNEENIPVRIDCGSIWENETIAIGTIGDGLFLIRLEDNQLTHIHSPRLQDLNIHGLCFTDKNSLWLSLDNGISSILLDPDMYLWKSNTEIGTFFDAVHFDGKTYVGSNQGMYIYEDDGNKIQTSIFPLRFCNLKNELLCGSTTGLYKKTSQQSDFQQLRNINGVEQFEYIADHGNEYLFLRAYSGISLLQYKDNTWKYLSALMGTESYTDIMPENLHSVWAIHSGKGIFRLRVDESMNRITDSDNFSEIDGYSNYANITIIKVEDKILFVCPKGIYQFDITEKKFKRQKALSQQIQHLDRLQSVKFAHKSNVWIAANDELFLYRITDLSAELVLHLPFVHNGFTLYDRHLQLKSVNDSIAFVSTFEGTIVINNQRVSQRKSNSRPLRIESLSYMGKNNSSIYVDSHHDAIEFPNTATHITVKVATGLQGYPTPISYRLPGVSDEWTPWQTDGTIYFTNLPSGTYALEIRDYNRNLLTIPIHVTQPFYKQTWMILLYVLLLVIITIGLVTLFSERKRKRLLQQYEDEQRKYTEELQKKAYEQLQEKATNQENELKNRMRFLSQKQELLDSIATEVETQKKELGERYPNKLYQRLMRIIQEGATEKDKFLSFENYFVEVHYEFMLRMQKAHPALSASELKFCCLLRANLSTKEISVIMGIALRSVELKKYRLKQKLDLDANSSLTSYILTI